MPRPGEFKPVPEDFVSVAIDCDWQIKKLASHYSVADDTVRRRWMPQVERHEYDLSELPKGRPGEMLKERDLDPEEWMVRGLRVNEWEMAGETQRQTRLDIVPRKDVLRPARVDGWKPPKPKARKSSTTNIDFVCGDHQAPYIDEAMHKATLNWLAEVKPRRGIINGDLIDLPSVSRYAKKHKWDASVNECIDSAYRILCEYRSASPDTQFILEEGNHEQRLAKRIAQDLPEAASIHRAGESEPALTVEYLLRLDELGIEYVGDYPHGLYKLADDVASIHGDKVKSGSGASGLATLIQRGYNVYIGHIHRQSITEHTWHDIDGEMHVKYAIEVGASCQVKGGLGHTVSPDWQNGHATSTTHKDGTFQPELINWQNGKLLWRGDSWK